MGVSDSPLEYAAKMQRASLTCREACAKSTEAAAATTKRVILARAPARLRNVGKSGSPLNVRYKGGDYEDGAQYLVFAVGRAWPIIERDTKPHPIPRFTGQRASKKTGLTKQYGPAFGQDKKQKPIVIGGNVRSRVFHPGTQGKHIFEQGVATGLALARVEYIAGQVAAMRTVF